MSLTQCAIPILISHISLKTLMPLWHLRVFADLPSQTPCLRVFTSSMISQNSSLRDLQRAVMAADLQRAIVAADLQRAIVAADLQRAIVAADLQRAIVAADLRDFGNKGKDITM